MAKTNTSPSVRVVEAVQEILRQLESSVTGNANRYKHPAVKRYFGGKFLKQLKLLVAETDNLADEFRAADGLKGSLKKRKKRK